MNPYYLLGIFAINIIAWISCDVIEFIRAKNN